LKERFQTCLHHHQEQSLSSSCPQDEEDDDGESNIFVHFLDEPEQQSLHYRYKDASFDFLRRQILRVE